MVASASWYGVYRYGWRRQPTLVPILSAQGAVLAGLMANRILNRRATLPVQVELIGLVTVMVFAILGPCWGAPADEPLIGSADIQSLADLGNSFEVVRGLRWVPFTTQTVLHCGATLLPRCR